MSTLETFLEVARTLEAEGRVRKPPARLFFLTDRERTPDPVAVAERLPPGAAVIHRTFGAADAPETAQALRAATRRRGCLLLIAPDEALAAACSADGLHLPERMLGEGSTVRRRHPGWVLTGAAHSAAAVQAAADLDAVLVSTVFASASPSAGALIGVGGLAELARGADVPLIALGGVNSETARLLIGSGAAGLAAVEAWLPSPAGEKERTQKRPA